MRTRQGTSYPTVKTVCSWKRRDPDVVGAQTMNSRKRMKSSSGAPVVDVFDKLPNDVVLCILERVGSVAACPADFVGVLSTCQRLNGLGLDSVVLSKASAETFAVKGKNWSESAHRFLKRCADAGNVEACYTLGMIEFYCLQNRGSGSSLMARAAITSHAPALYSLAVIQFNGSGGSKNEKDLRSGVALCARAAFQGHIDALRELGHCLQDGYGVRQNIAQGRRFLVQANARELAGVIAGTPLANLPGNWLGLNTHPVRRGNAGVMGCPLLSDFGFNVPPPQPHPANRFLTDWVARQLPDLGLRLCSHACCGRPETRVHEFRRCSVCGVVNYCSRACQALDWKMRHKTECGQMERFVNVNRQGDMIVES